VPADAVGLSGTAITIAFDLEMEDLDCTPRQMNMPWAFVAEDSTLYLPAGDTTEFLLSGLPAPFLKDSRLNDVLLVVSDDPSETELNLAGRIMAMIGSGSEPYGTFRAIRASSFSTDDADHNIILTGTASGNSVAQAVNDSLIFSFNSDFSALESTDRFVMTDEFAKEAGVLQIISSPYAAARALLSAVSPGDTGMEAVSELVSSEKSRWSLEKQAIIIDSEGNIRTFLASSSDSSTKSGEKPSFTDVVNENKEPMFLLLVGLGCMLLVLLGTILVLIRIRPRYRGKDKEDDQNL